MGTLNELEPGEWLSEPLVVTVTKVEDSSVRNRSAEVYFEDTEGNESYLIDWQRTSLGIDWIPGRTYILSDLSVKKGGQGYRVYLDLTSKAEVIEIGESPPETRLVIMGDSHVGRRRHPRGRRSIDCATQFQKAVQKAVELEADAVIHTGDVFHDGVTEEDLRVVERSIDILREHETPFYYIIGNHECREGVELLEDHQNRDVITHLTPEGTSIGDRVVVYGIDHHSPDTFPRRSVRQRDRTEDFHILVLHQTLSSVRDGDGVDLPKSTLSEYDYVLSGHLHDAEHHDWHTGTVLYAGPTEWLSRKPSASTPSVWLLTARDDGIETERHPIR